MRVITALNNFPTQWGDGLCPPLSQCIFPIKYHKKH